MIYFSMKMRYAFAILAAVLWGTAAHADQIASDPVPFSTPFVLGAMDVSGTVPLFDPSLGTLSRVTLTVFMEVDGAAATLTNTSLDKTAFVFGDKFDFIVRAFGVEDLDNPSPIFPTLLTVGPIAPGQTVALVQDPMLGYSFQSQTLVYLPPVGYYVGHGLAPVLVDARYSLIFPDGSLHLDVTAGTFSGYVQATYDFTPFSDPASAPEPATWGAAVFGAICFGLSLARRGFGVRSIV